MKANRMTYKISLNFLYGLNLNVNLNMISNFVNEEHFGDDYIS